MSYIIARSGAESALQLASSFRQRTPTSAQLVLQSERHNRLLRRLRLEGKIYFPGLAERLRLSVRRDLS